MSEYKTRDMKLRLSFLGSSYTWARGRLCLCTWTLVSMLLNWLC